MLFVVKSHAYVFYWQFVERSFGHIKAVFYQFVRKAYEPCMFFFSWYKTEFYKTFAVSHAPFHGLDFSMLAVL